MWCDRRRGSTYRLIVLLGGDELGGSLSRLDSRLGCGACVARGRAHEEITTAESRDGTKTSNKPDVGALLRFRRRGGEFPERRPERGLGSRKSATAS